MKSLEELRVSTQYVLSAPKDRGNISMFCVRPNEGERMFPSTLELSIKRGAIGDCWEKGTWLSLDDGSPSPDVQISILPQRIYELVCCINDAIHPGDTIIADLDLSEDNIPVGQRLTLGSATIEVSNIPNYGCDQWAHRYGHDALRYVAAKENQPYRLRGVLCKVVKDGTVNIDDKITLG